jgi:hypothetical protein
MSATDPKRTFGNQFIPTALEFAPTIPASRACITLNSRDITADSGLIF